MLAQNKNNHGTKIPMLSFFTGAGFMDIGFLQQGFQMVWHNEYHPAFVTAFETGLPSLGYRGTSVKIQNTRSIVDIGPNEIIKEAFGGGKPPGLFGVIGGPPCPDFSVGGKNRGHLGDNGRLSEVYVNRIIELNPTFFVFENVPGLLRTAKHREFLVRLLHKLADRYALDLRILNALDFGVPQDRERVFIVGFQKRWLKKKFSNASYKHITDAAEFIPLLSKLTPKRFFAEVTHWFPWPEIPEFKGAKYKFDWPKELVPKGKSPLKPKCPEQLMVGTYLCDERRLSLPNGMEGFKPKSDKFNTTENGRVIMYQ